MYRTGKFVYPETPGISASNYTVDCIGMIRTAFKPYSYYLFDKCAKAVYGLEKQVDNLDIRQKL